MATIPQNLSEECQVDEPEPRGLAIVIALATVTIQFALPHSLSVVSPYLLFGIVGVLLSGTILSRRARKYKLNNLFGYALTGTLTLVMIWSLFLLIRGLPRHIETPKELFISAASLWVTNIFIFASWYWRIDAGCPNVRDLRPCHTDGDFLFPQMALDAEKRLELGIVDWSPTFADYLFLAFNTNTAFSPTDTAVLKPRAKLLMMLQAIISLIIIAILAGRAVNIL